MPLPAPSPFVLSLSKDEARSEGAVQAGSACARRQAQCERRENAEAAPEHAWPAYPATFPGTPAAEAFTAVAVVATARIGPAAARKFAVPAAVSEMAVAVP